MTTGLQIDAIILADRVRQIGKQGDLHTAQTALLARCIDPGQVGEVRVHTNANDFGVYLAELGNAIGKGNDLRGADKGAGRIIGI